MSITAEKTIEKFMERYSRLPNCAAQDFLKHLKENGFTLLQQGEPEGWARRPFDVRVHEKPIREITDAVFIDGWRKSEGASVQLQLEECFLAYLEKISASPLPPAPGAETGDPDNNPLDYVKDVLGLRSSSRQAALEEAAKKVVEKATFHFSEHNRFAREGRGDLATLHMNRAFDYENLASGIRALATTPPAEGETK